MARDACFLLIRPKFQQMQTEMARMGAGVRARTSGLARESAGGGCMGWRVGGQERRIGLAGMIFRVNMN